MVTRPRPQLKIRGVPGPAGRPWGRRTCHSVPEGAGQPEAGADRDGGELHPAPRPARFPPARAVTAALPCCPALAWPGTASPLISGAKVPAVQEHRLLAARSGRVIVAVKGEARMFRRPAVSATRAARAVRGLWPDRNPLRRTMDRVEAMVAGGLVIAFLAGGPLAAVAAGHAVYSAGSRTAHAQQATWRQVPAVLLAAAPPAGFRQDQVTVPARWTGPDGTRHTGTVPVPAGTRAGHPVMVWVDAAGRLTGRRPGSPPPCTAWQAWPCSACPLRTTGHRSAAGAGACWPGWTT